MASSIKIKRSEVSGNPAILGAGELAYSALVDNGSNGGDRLYIGSGTETSGNAVNHVVIGGKYFTDMITAATDANTASTLIRRDASGNFVAGTITAALTGNASSATILQTARTINGVSFDGSANITITTTAASFASQSATTVLAAPTLTAGTPTFRVLSLEDIPDAWVKKSVRAATTANITLSAPQTIDGIVLVAGDRVLVKDQTLTYANGIYVVAAAAWTRTLDADNISKLAGANVNVDSGTVNGGFVFNNDTKITDILNTTAITFFRNVDYQDTATANTASKIVLRDASGNFAAGTITAALTGNASTATAWATGRTLAITGDITYTSPSITGAGNVTAAATLATVNANIGTWNNVTVNAKGLVTAGSNTAYLTANQSISVTGDATATGTTGLALTLATVNATVGTFGSTTAIPVVTVNAKGLVTSVTTAAISSTLAIAGGTGTDNVSVGTDTLTFAGGTGVATTVTDNQVSFAIGQAVATTSNVTFNDVTVSGTLNSNDITAASVNIAGDAVITGNLTVNGTTTTINATNLSVADLNITVAKDATTATAANGAGLTVNGPTIPATILYTSADDSWTLNKTVRATTIVGALTGNATTATSWATGRTLAITGDITYTSPSITGAGNVTAAATLATVNANVGTWNNLTVNGKGLVTGGSNVAYLTANQTITASGDATGSGTTGLALTLANVNSNVGSFGSGTSVPSFTVNAKGLITAASATAIPTATTTVLGLASFATAEFNVTAGAVTVKMVDGGTY